MVLPGGYQLGQLDHYSHTFAVIIITGKRGMSSQEKGGPAGPPRYTTINRCSRSVFRGLGRCSHRVGALSGAANHFQMVE